MPLDQEPPDGDYAAYIDKLVNGRKGSPGAIAKPMRRGQRRRSGTLPNEGNPASPGDESSGDPLPGHSLPGDPTLADTRRKRSAAPAAFIRRDHNSHTEFEYVSPDGEPAKADSLGPQGSARLTGIVQILLGLGALALFARAALHMTYSHDPFSLDHIVPLILLGFIARMFLARGHARLREAGSRPIDAGQVGKHRRRRGRLP